MSLTLLPCITVCDLPLLQKAMAEFRQLLLQKDLEIAELGGNLRLSQANLNDEQG